MKWRAIRYAALAGAVYLAGLVALFPASLAVRWFVPDIPGLHLGVVEGTIWNGRVNGIDYQGWSPGNATWSLQPLSLFSLAIAADVRLERSGKSPMTANVRVTADGHVRVNALHGVITLAELARAQLLPPNIATGDILLEMASIEFLDGRLVAAEGRAGLAGLRSTLLPGVALGSYEGNVETGGGGVNAVFHEVEAPLRVAGQATLQPDGRYAVSGNITPTSETPENLARGLMLLGQPDASGRYEFNFSGRL